jgi:hypothetical protein
MQISRRGSGTAEHRAECAGSLYRPNQQGCEHSSRRIDPLVTRKKFNFVRSSLVDEMFAEARSGTRLIDDQCERALFPRRDGYRKRASAARLGQTPCYRQSIDR